MESAPPDTGQSIHTYFARTMTWRAALSLALALPAAALSVIGYWVGALGGWTAATLLAISATIAILQNFTYAEMASMFPDRAGGVAAYAYQAWRDKMHALGALASAGYWVGWSFGLTTTALIIGELVHTQWFPEFNAEINAGPVQLGLTHLIALGTLLGVWLLNLFGIEPAVRVSYVINALVVCVMVAVVGAAIVQGQIHFDRLTWSLTSVEESPAIIVACVWLFLMGWTVYGTEIAATFTPEYRNPRADVPKALTAAGLISLLVFAVMPIVVTGALGEAEITANPLAFNVTLFDTLFGAAGPLAIVVLCLAMLNLMSVSIADSGRALYGMAESGLTIRQLGVLNRFRMPGRAMAVGLVLNIGLILFVGNLLGVIFASNLGYFVAVIIALAGYLVLRRANVAPDRAFRLPRWWDVVAAALALINLAFFLIAATHPTLTGYGGWKEELIGFGVLVVALTMYGYRRHVQDRTA